MKTIIEVQSNEKKISVEKLETGKYQVLVDGVIKHPELEAEDVMRTLGWYLHNTETKKSRS